MKLQVTLGVFVITLFAGACILEAPDPPIDPPPCSFVCGSTYPLDPPQKSALEGIYLVENGSDLFGSTVVIKWNSPTHMTILTGQDVSYFVLQAGRLDSVFFFEGYWRSQSSHRSGLAAFTITKDAGGRRLMMDSSASREIVLDGTVGEGTDRPSVPVRLRYQWSIRPEILARKFWIIAHRGGGRMSELPPHSENTVELIRIAEQFGVNAIEIDVRLTKDDVPILYHDNTLNPRLVRKTPMIGSVEDYTFAQLRTYIRLIEGERIPMLDEALKAVVYETNLSLVWLDPKTEERGIMQRIAPILEQYQTEADMLAAQGMRDSLEIMVGVPTDKIYEELRNHPSITTVPTIAERSLAWARVLNSQVWAPLWSAGINTVDNATAHAEGRRIFVWTLDEPQFIREYINSGQYDGVLSDYPMIVAYYHYVR